MKKITPWKSCRAPQLHHAGDWRCSRKWCRNNHRQYLWARETELCVRLSPGAAGTTLLPTMLSPGRGSRVPAMHHNSQNWVFFLLRASTVKKCRSTIKKLFFFYQSPVTEKKLSRWSLWKVKCSLSPFITVHCGQWSVPRGHRFRLYTTVRLLTVPVKPHCTNCH